jgi:D-glycero-D-manno-heptose 1,7-bisphosphate phosphatase
LRAAVFLDRDGVINRNVPDRESGKPGAPRTVAELVMAAGAVEALAALQQAGFPLILVSNQPNYAKGKSSLEELAGIHDRLLRELAAGGVRLTAAYYCYHHPGGIVAGYSGSCECRKPSPFFLFQARDEFGLSLEESWMIGDRVTDVACGRAAGTRTIRVLEDHPALRRADELKADYEAKDLGEAAEIILRFRGHRI